MESQLINKQKIDNKLFFIGGGGVSDIEMIPMDSLTSYTSLKDILRSNSSSSSPSVAADVADTPTTKFKRIDSWKAIPMKDPLLQHAAWAYLQPMTSEPHSDDHRCSCFWKLKDCFCGFFTRH